MNERVRGLPNNFPEDDFDLERFKRQTLANKKTAKHRKKSNPYLKKIREESLAANNAINENHGRIATLSEVEEKLIQKISQAEEVSIDKDLIEYDDTETIFMSGVNLHSIRKKTLTRKREKFWERKSKLFYLISTLVMMVLFTCAYYVFHFMVQFIQEYTLLR